ncbi:Aminopeptidase N [Polaribacter huanghezhanensis]|uniref:M1 family metallopeptidase n=1 Tax=Polaribacter huanghezhanensis TaxID=1354726 RepID=UPI00264A1756|nr:M1 family metallopeptidase [Polaribacter huanghezhanensis]WKD85448.1 Aminopeptidase N [Polaribacter huanghezhanensis]
MKKTRIIILSFFIGMVAANAQKKGYWQQHVNYTMNVDVDVNNFQYNGTQKLVYTNNSSDALTKVYYHLFYNAFQPDSEMNARLQDIADPDGRMTTKSGTKEKPIYESRISKLKPNEIGYLKVLTLKQNGKNVHFETAGTILEVTLNTPIKPGSKVTFDMTFKGQLPVHIRRAGRNNPDGVAMSMAQWYPKMAEYDFEGWHADSYIAREFHGVWGDFDVTLHIDKKYTVAGTGNLENPQEIGHGYENKAKKLKLQKGKKLAWHFKAKKVHDFAWAADDNYIHDIVKVKNGPDIHFFFKNNEDVIKNWRAAEEPTAKAMEYFSENIGKYPWKQYSVIQAGDGGMEYAMCTFVAGGEKRSPVGTIFHELAHTWFQQLLASNESKHPWMDEGFTTYISGLASNKILRGGDGKPSAGGYRGYFYLVKSGFQEPLTTHSDRYNLNMAYSIASYTMGGMFLTQLNYIIGEENTAKTLKKYFVDFSFKHPTPNDIKRTVERVSGLELDWYLNEWTETTHRIDYAVDNVDGKTITLKRIGKMPMPTDVTVTYTDGSVQNFNIPLLMMRGHKPTTATVLTDWGWAHPTYTFTVDKEIKKVEIDPSQLMADIDRDNNVYEALK